MLPNLFSISRITRSHFTFKLALITAHISDYCNLLLGVVIFHKLLFVGKQAILLSELGLDRTSEALLIEYEIGRQAGTGRRVLFLGWFLTCFSQVSQFYRVS